ncbi:unnamed protein product [Pieris brassicae]|uniref:Uncharacterized protein n=1 Tax=Pieris brassicae TaxID=7116 RepID=A0A9P0X848_PIEBR|nr:unnamed protein product [Pieris brassicae]
MEPRGLGAPPARAARPGELIQVASAPLASRNPQVCPFCFWCLLRRVPFRAPRVYRVYVYRAGRYVCLVTRCDSLG